MFLVKVSGVDVNNIKVSSGAMKMLQWFHFALLSSYKVFRGAVNNNKY